jgi:hypothetical protein
MIQPSSKNNRRIYSSWFSPCTVSFRSFDENAFVASLLDSFISNIYIHIYIYIIQSITIFFFFYSYQRVIVLSSFLFVFYPFVCTVFFFVVVVFELSVYEHSTVNHNKKVHGYCNRFVHFWNRHLLNMAFFFVMQRYLFIPVVCVCILYKKHNKEKHWFLFLNICLSLMERWQKEKKSYWWMWWRQDDARIDDSFLFSRQIKLVYKIKSSTVFCKTNNNEFPR